MTPATQLRLWCGVALVSFCGSAFAQNAIVTSPADVFAGPDDSYPPVAQLEPDTPVRVNGCLDDWSWCDVSFEDNRGWVYAPDITYAYEGGYVPLYSYGPALGIPVVVFSLNEYWDHYYRARPWYGQREEWIRRGPAQHRRPTGPPPSANPPPRSVITQRPHMGDRGDEAIRLGSAEGQRRDNAGVPRRDDRARDTDAERAAEARHDVEARRAAEAQRGAEQRREGAEGRRVEGHAEDREGRRVEGHAEDRAAHPERAQPREPSRPEHEDQPH